MSFDIGVVMQGLNLVLQPWTLVMIVLGVLAAS